MMALLERSFEVRATAARRAGDRRRLRRARGRQAGRLVLLRQRRSRARGRRRAQALPRRSHLVGPPRRTTAIASRRSWARSRSRSAPGMDGKKLPIRLVCLGSEDRSCDEVETRLKRPGSAGWRARTSSPRPVRSCAILVGRWSDVRKDIAARTLEAGPAVVRRVREARRPAGPDRRCWTPTATSPETLGAGAGLVAATSYHESARPGSSPAPTTWAWPRRPPR